MTVLRKIIKASLAAGGVGLALLSSSLALDGYQTKLEKTVLEVPVGEIRYSNGPVISHNFVACSAVIFDYGDRTIMAHALPTLSNYATLGEKEGVGTYDVIDDMVKMSEEKGLNYRNADVIIDAGDKESLDVLLHSANRHGLRIIRVNTERIERIAKIEREEPDKIFGNGWYTTIFYDPLTNNLRSRPTRLIDTGEP